MAKIRINMVSFVNIDAACLALHLTYKHLAKDRWCIETLDGMIEIRRGGCEALITSGTGAGVREFWNPAIAVFAPDVNDQVRLHPADMIAAFGGT